MKAHHPAGRILSVIAATIVLFSSIATAQTKKGKGKYPSLLWEITGNGIKKPSYLFGTMHVSSKVVFHLSDSFYHAIKSAEVVALETNPENWQDDFTNSKMMNAQNGIGLRGLSSGFAGGMDMMNDYLTINTFAFRKYEKAIATALSAQPEIINNLLYRNFAGAEDFEEDTFLDMYIFQAGKKLGKTVTGVENFEESEKLVMEAYRDAAKDRNTKRRSYDFNNYADPQKLQDAYRRGDLDMLDSLNKLNTYSEAFEEKFLYRRNDIQAKSIDSIIKSGSSLFVGVGAAHLPGTRGVIEWLRKHGYNLRPVLMGERDSNQKDQVDKIRIALNFSKRWAEDSAFSVNLPGKLYRFSPIQFINQLQFADMVNGAYYMVTRLKTNSFLWGQNISIVSKKVDSMLYENVPGKIISKKDIIVNGYKGFDIINKTRRGDFQRYNIIITPFEIFFFKMSGNSEFVTTGDEARKFFESIQIKSDRSGEWTIYSPPYGGFTVSMPGKPVLNKVYPGGINRFEYEAVDEKEGSSYLIMKTNVHNISFIEEDTFDLNLIDESFASSSFIDKTLSRKPGVFKGYPSLDVKYKHKDGSITQARYIIQGPHYYALLAHGKKESAAQTVFLNSFSVSPFTYPEVKKRTDTTLGITVISPVYPEDKSNDLQNWMKELMEDYGENEAGNNADFPSSFKMITVGNDTAGEKIMAMYYKLPKYKYFKDSSSFWDKGEIALHDSDFIYRKFEKNNLPGGFINYDIQLSDTNSSRTILGKVFYHDGVVHLITAITDTLTPMSSLLTNFFSSFKPSDTIKGYSPFIKKSAIFLADYYSTDSATKKKAIKYLDNMYFDSSDVPAIKKAIQELTWKDKDYLELKKEWIQHLGKMKDTTVSYYLKDMYKNSGDTVELQNTILETLLSQKTTTAYRLFKDIMLEEPPVLENNNGYGLNVPRRYYDITIKGRGSYYKSGLFSYLYDSAQLTKTLFPEFLALMTLDDYKPKIMDLLSSLVDSGFIKATDYQEYYNKFWLEAKQELRKQSIAEKTKSIEKKQEELDDKKPVVTFTTDDESSRGNDELDLYGVLLMPFWDKNENIPSFYNRLLQTNDNKIKYHTALLLLRNNKPVPDSIWKYFAAMDTYRSDLFDDLEEIKHLDKFPAQYKTQADIARSLLINSRSYDKADTIIYLDKLPVNYKGDKGWLYFYKYKDKKDDAVWEFATSGLQPENLKEVNTDDDFTSFMENNMDEEKPVKEQLQKLLKEILYSRRKSARSFYEKGYSPGNMFGGGYVAPTEEDN
ncbi:MAG: TraB/GumN family protein [Sphingobacteriales bacterium]|nr:TraB/GumN family protein [Sphingobacteriales bacterium]